MSVTNFKNGVRGKYSKNKPRIEFASTDEMNKLSHNINEFCKNILKMKPENVLISDESNLSHFPENSEIYVERIKSKYGINVKGQDKIFNILKRIGK